MTHYPPPQGHPQSQYQYSPPPRKRRKWPWVLLAIAVLMIAGFAACTAAVGSAVNQATAAKSYTYELTGDGGDSVNGSWSTPGGIVSQGVDLPFSTKVDFPEGQIATATLSGSLIGGGTIACKITDQDGNVVAQNTVTSEQVASVSCTPGIGSPVPGQRTG